MALKKCGKCVNFSIVADFSFRGHLENKMATAKSNILRNVDTIICPQKQKTLTAATVIGLSKFGPIGNLTIV